MHENGGEKKDGEHKQVGLASLVPKTQTWLFPKPRWQCCSKSIVINFLSGTLGMLPNNCCIELSTINAVSKIHFVMVQFYPQSIFFPLDFRYGNV